MRLICNVKVKYLKVFHPVNMNKQQNVKNMRYKHLISHNIKLVCNCLSMDTECRFSGYVCCAFSLAQSSRKHNNTATGSYNIADIQSMYKGHGKN